MRLLGWRGARGGTSDSSNTTRGPGDFAGTGILRAKTSPSRNNTAVWLDRTTWAFVVLGLTVRLVRYLVNYPIWHDEAFLAVNFIDRDYLDLLRPLDYAQVSPILFLWTELSVVAILGFSERTLRLFPRALPWRACSCFGTSCAARRRGGRRGRGRGAHRRRGHDRWGRRARGGHRRGRCGDDDGGARLRHGLGDHRQRGGGRRGGDRPARWL